MTGGPGELLRRRLERFPRLYISLAHRRRASGPRRPLVDSTTDVVVEGFPRSGNTHLLAWLTVGNPELRIASHAHTIAHVRTAIHWKIPAVVLLRPPEEAIASETIRANANGQRPHAAVLVDRYERFYDRALQVADHIIISSFEVTTRQTDAVVSAMAAAGVPVTTTAPDAREVTKEVERINRLHSEGAEWQTVARPSAQRKALSERIRTDLRRDHGPALDRLQDLHDRLAAHPSALT